MPAPTSAQPEPPQEEDTGTNSGQRSWTGWNVQPTGEPTKGITEPAITTLPQAVTKTFKESNYGGLESGSIG